MPAIRRPIIALTFAAALLPVQRPCAAEPVAPRFVSEIRIGLGAHDPGGPERGSIDLRATALFSPLARTNTAFPLVIRPHLGLAANTAGRTSHAHAGLTATLDLSRYVFVEASLGGAIHNGRIGNALPTQRAALGCPVLFREALGVGYRFDAHWTMVASVEHLSNSGLCGRNRGLTNLGIELGYRF